MIALFGWQNRLNDTLQTDLDQHTLDWAAQFGLAEKTGWDPDRSSRQIADQGRVRIAHMAQAQTAPSERRTPKARPPSI